MRAYTMPNVFQNSWSPKVMPNTNLALTNDFNNYQLGQMQMQQSPTGYPNQGNQGYPPNQPNQGNQGYPPNQGNQGYPQNQGNQGYNPNQGNQGYNQGYGQGGQM